MTVTEGVTTERNKTERNGFHLSDVLTLPFHGSRARRFS